VGYQVRFNDATGEDTLVKLMTDGILLAEIGTDRLLRRYDTLIIDEAHERSLNIDFILGYLSEILPRRPDLKVIITSATIDPQRFARHFGGGKGQQGGNGRPAPVIEVSGRTYPVEVRYRPLAEESDEDEVAYRDQTQGICDAVDELCAQGPGDILVFLSGEREIRDTADVLSRQRRPNTEVLPLYARLSVAEQHRVFARHNGRRIVLATNVAETSLTVPGIKYVIDPGTARISRYSNRTKVQRLPIEPVSQASANQRKGRCGRVSDGICVRLYSEQDFLARPEFTDPEILRTTLASVILQMTALGLGDIAAFGFVDPPDARNIRDGVQLLTELGAIDPSASDPRKRLTPVGRKLAALPVDPRLGRMVLEAECNGCLVEVMVIAAALSIQDPRERPADKQQAAAEKHARFSDGKSDFLSYLNLWRYLREQQRDLSCNRFRRMCRAEFLNYLRIREWQDIYSQLRRTVKSLGVAVPGEGDYGAPDFHRVHVSLLAGMLSHIGLKEGEKNEYQGGRGAMFAIFPGSALFKKPPRWVMAAELVETSRLWGRVVAGIEPEWAESLAGDLVKRNYSEPHWSKKQGAVMAYEKVTLYGVPIVASRRVNYSRVEPELCRAMFIRHALVEGEWQTRHAFFHANRALLAEVEDLEHRARRKDILVDDQTLFEFYDERVGSEVVSARHFDSWWKQARRKHPELLDFSTTMLINPGTGVSEQDYPESVRHADHEFGLSYQFEPGAEADGVTVRVPLAVLNQVDPDSFDWPVPGLREELVTALIKTLPKPLRRNFVPVPDHTRAVLARVQSGEEPLLPALERELGAMRGVSISRADWELDRLPAHLRTSFEVVDPKGHTVALGKDLAALQRQLTPRVRQTIAAEATGLERSGVRAWDIGELPKMFTQRRGDQTVKGYPALVDETDSVAVRVFGTVAEQQRAMWSGTRRLVLLDVPSPVRTAQKGMTNGDRLVLAANPHGGIPALLEDCVIAAADQLIAEAGGPAWDGPGFAGLVARVRAGLGARLQDMLPAVHRVLAAAGEVERGLAELSGKPRIAPAVGDLRRQLSGLLYPGFVAATGAARLPHLARYLQGMLRRMEKLPTEPVRDAEWMAAVARMAGVYREALDALPAGSQVPAALREVRWMIEELRVSFYAQQLGTAYPVSEKRILRALAR
ncbi:MAG: ATP-dependent RNA helicase HrpA, partial [Sciscionella sp.]